MPVEIPGDIERFPDDPRGAALLSGGIFGLAAWNLTRVDVDPTVLREYDVRGIVGETITAADAYALGRAFGSLARRRGAKALAVGYDGLLSWCLRNRKKTYGLATLLFVGSIVAATRLPTEFFPAHDQSIFVMEITTAEGKIIRMNVGGISRIGRATQGVRVIQLDEDDVNEETRLRYRFGDRLLGRHPFRSVCRPVSASPATGSRASHELEQQLLMERVFGPDVRK